MRADGEPQFNDNHKTIKTLLDGVDLSALQGEHQKAGAILAKAETGYATVHGGSGSGKSTLGRTISKSLYGHGTGPVLYAVPQNSLLPSTSEGLEVKGCKVRRVLPFKREENYLLWGAAQDRKQVPSLASKSDKAIINHFNAYIDKIEEEQSPTRIPNCLSRIASQMADERVNLIKTTRENQPDRFAKEQPTFAGKANELLQEVAMEADALVGTPVALAELADHVSGLSTKAKAIFLDEAARMNETMVWMIISRFPDTPVFMLGDTKQYKPICQALQDRSSESIFGPQRTVSLMERLFALDKMTVTLRDNHRALGDVGRWPQLFFYPHDMNLTRRDMPREYQIKMAEFRKMLFGVKVDSSMVFIDLKSTREQQVGTTFVNSSSAEFLVETVVFAFNAYYRVFGRKPSVLINTPYSAQKVELDGRLAAVSDAELDKACVMCFSIDSSPSLQADLVFTDLVRTFKPGFMTDPNRNAVKSTRALQFQAIFGSVDATSRIMKNFIQYCEPRHALITIDEVSVCYKCKKAGHKGNKCTATLRCTACGKDHHIRNCFRSAKFPQRIESWSSPLSKETIEIKSELTKAKSTFDEVYSASTTSPNEGRRVKFRMSERHEQSRKPASAEAAARNRFRSSYSSYIQREAQNEIEASAQTQHVENKAQNETEASAQTQ